MNILKTFLAGGLTVSVFIIQSHSDTVKDTGETVRDADGNVYHTVKMGNQIWTVENLRTTKFNDGTAIPLVTGDSEWAALASPGYCFYNHITNSDSIKGFGALYNWYAVDTRKLAPEGWRVPTDDDWKMLEKYVACNSYKRDRAENDNKITKSLAARTGWTLLTRNGAVGNDRTTNNEGGFSALPAGCRLNGGAFIYLGNGSYWWSATEAGASKAFTRYLYFNYDTLNNDYFYKRCGLSVRLLKDN